MNKVEERDIFILDWQIKMNVSYLLFILPILDFAQLSGGGKIQVTKMV